MGWKELCFPGQHLHRCKHKHQNGSDGGDENDYVFFVVIFVGRALALFF